MTLESGLVLEGIVMTPTRVETKDQEEITGTEGSRPWDTSWFSRMVLTRTLLYNRATDATKA